MNTKDEQVFDAVIIGAGICGLAAARKLGESGKSVLVLDKARGPGGRMATRREDQARFDHGAQFFTVRDESFRREIDLMVAEGVVREWCRGFPSRPGDAVKDGHPRYRGGTGMNAPAKFLARDLDVRLNHRVRRVSFQAETWRVWCENENAFRARALLMTAPVPQSLAILNESKLALAKNARAALEKIEYDPCIAALVQLNGPSNLPAPGALQLRSEPVDFISDNFARGISPVPALTIHGGARFSREHLELEPLSAARLLTEAAREFIAMDAVASITGHRWLYAKPCVSHAERALALREPGPLVFAGDAFGEARVEGAFLSGLAAAEFLENETSNRPA